MKDALLAGMMVDKMDVLLAEMLAARGVEL